MPDEYEIRAVMDHSGCDRETAVKALEHTKCRIAAAIRRVTTELAFPKLHCHSCGESVAKIWKYCPYCGVELEGSKNGLADT